MIKMLWYFCTILLLCYSCENSDVQESVPFTGIQHSNIQYGNEKSNYLDIYSPLVASGSNPVVVFVHGGAWSGGDKSHWSNRQAEFLASLGFISISINYALSPDPIQIENTGRVMHPLHIQDVALSIRWVYDHIANYGGNPNEIFLIGHSAGAHLVALLATNERFLVEQKLDLNVIKGVIALDNGPYLTDPESMFSSTTPDVMSIGMRYQNAFGITPEKYLDATPLQFIMKGKKIPPFLLVYCDIDYRKKPNEIFTNELVKNKFDVKSVLLQSWSDHVGVLEHIGNPNDPIGVSLLVKDFLSKND